MKRLTRVVEVSNLFEFLKVNDKKSFFDLANIQISNEKNSEQDTQRGKLILGQVDGRPISFVHLADIEIPLKAFPLPKGKLMLGQVDGRSISFID